MFNSLPVFESSPLPLDSNIFPVNSKNRVVLPLPQALGESRPSIILPTVPTIPRISHSLRRSKGLPKGNIDAYSRPMTSHQRNISDSSDSTAFSTTSFASDSDDNTRCSPNTTPSSSRSSSPCGKETSASTSSLRLIRCSKPFPPNFGLSDVSAEDALVFYPDANKSSRAILLLGPAIARHLHIQNRSSKLSGRFRAHRYRITPSRHASMCHDADRAMLVSLKKQLDRAKKEDRSGWGLWTRGGSLEQRLRNLWHEQRKQFGTNDILSRIGHSQR